MLHSTKTYLTRRSLLRRTLLSGSAFFFDSRGIALLSFLRAQQKDFANAQLLGTLDFIHESSAPLNTLQGSELDGRLNSDLSSVEAQSPITPVKNFYVRTRASELLPDPATWQLKIGGLVEQPIRLEIEALRKTAKPMGVHVMECAGNVRLARFGLLSTGNWTGVPVSEILDKAKTKSASSPVLISGFDRYAKESKTSVPGASWVFTRQQLEKAGAFLATELNGQPLTRDHGAPVRLVVPGWYGCTCIKWVNEIAFVGEEAEATSQMQEYAARTMQKGVPQQARDYQPAVIEQAAMPIRVEKWQVSDKIIYRVVGVAWGGSRPAPGLQIRFNPEEDFVPVDNFSPSKNDPWTMWTHAWSPKTPGTYSIRLALKDSSIPARRLNSGYYVRTVEIG